MDLHELIIKAHARAHAAELAVHAKCQDAAWNELFKLCKMLSEELEHIYITPSESPPPESPQ